jgi:two-component system sensor histidine kinase UhpB
MTLLWRIFLGNAAILAAGTAVLIVSPATVSFPVAASQILVLGAGLVAMLGLNYTFLRRAVAPLQRLASVMREVDPLLPGRRAQLPAAASEIKTLAAAFDDMLDRLERERQDAARRALSAQELERRRIARELHDEVGQALTAILLMLNLALDRSNGYAAERINEAHEAARTTLNEVRAIARNLRPEALDELGLASALRQLCADLERTGVVIDRRIDSSVRLDADGELVVYRVAQEALTNALRHAKAQTITLQLDARDRGAVLRVHDDGRGLRGAPEGGGLSGMRERALLVGATLEASSPSGRGTLITLDIA